MKSTRYSTSSEDVRLISTQNCNFLDRKNMPIELVDIAGNVRVNRDSSDRPRLHTLSSRFFFGQPLHVNTESTELRHAGHHAGFMPIAIA